MFEVVVLLGVTALLICLPVFMVRGLIAILRDKDRVGTVSRTIGGMMMEFDRHVRPHQHQNILEVTETKPVHQDDVGGE